MVCMACRAARQHRKRLINERKQEKSPAHFNEKWCAAKCERRAEGVQRTSEWHPFSLAYAPSVWPATTALRASVAFEKVRMRHAKPYWMVSMLFCVPNMR